MEPQRVRPTEPSTAQLIYDAVLFSGMQQSVPIIHLCIPILFQILFSYGSLQSIEQRSCVIQQFLIDHLFYIHQSVSSVAQSRPTLCDPAAHQASLSIINSQSLLKPMSIELVMPCSHLILCRRLLLLPPICPSIRVFSSESTLCMRWPKYWSFSFSISSSIYVNSKLLIYYSHNELIYRHTALF